MVFLQLSWRKGSKGSRVKNSCKLQVSSCKEKRKTKNKIEKYSDFAIVPGRASQEPAENDLWLFERSESHRSRRFRAAQGSPKGPGTPASFFWFVFLSVQENEQKGQTATSCKGKTKKLGPRGQGFQGSSECILSFLFVSLYSGFGIWLAVFSFQSMASMTWNPSFSSADLMPAVLQAERRK